MKNRKGAIRMSEIPAEVLHALNQGKLETVNLVEGLAVNNKLLIYNVLKQYGREKYYEPIESAYDLLPLKTITKVNLSIGLGLLSEIKKNQDTAFMEILSSHTSDIVRGWASYLVGFDKDLPIEGKLEKIKPFASDTHFGVREFAWMVMRDGIADNLEKSIQILSKWSLSTDPYIRRFASEATRPRGVWCRHIEMLKVKPELALSILEPLKSDPERYVQNSVGNWLNDAAKTKPEWVVILCEDWLIKSPTTVTKYIVKRGMRSLIATKA